jgi:molybdate transport system substrate-binding protein
MKLLSALAVRAVVEPALAEFSRRSGHAVDAEFGTMGALRARLAGAEAADAMILTVPLLEALRAQGAASHCRVLARTDIGMAIRAGAARPDISTPDAFVQALRAARTIALTDPAAGGTAGVYLAGLMQRLGIAEAVAAKTLARRSGFHVARGVAAGETEIGLTLISEIVPVEGAALAGPLPAALQNPVTYAAGVIRDSDNAAAALALTEYLADAALYGRWQSCGFEIPGAAQAIPSGA